MIGIVNYGMGNLLSVVNAVEMCGADVKLINNADEFNNVDKIILPGVGAFKDCIGNLIKKRFIEALNEQVLIKKKMILGICLGMQVMAKKGYENGEHAGLGWFDAEVIKIKTNSKDLKVPHIGWNNIHIEKPSLLFKGINSGIDVYFVHSYHVKCNNTEDLLATCEYGSTVTAAINKENIFATQFHPEKSQDHGLRILSNFLTL